MTRATKGTSKETAEDKIVTYDTTLRDGTQSWGVQFSLTDKLKIAERLDQFGIHYIEGGWPGSNPKDMAFFDQIKNLELKTAKIVAFGCTRRARSAVKEDANIKSILQTPAIAAAIVGKSWDLHVREVINTTLEENLAMIKDTISYLKTNDVEIIYDAEHFFDGYKADPDYALKTIEMAQIGGADWICLCDTNGGALPSEIESTVSEVTREISTPLGIHVHNDGGVAIANTLAAVEAGTKMIQGTVNGYGERSGNADLCTLIPNLQFKMGYRCLKEGGSLGKLTSLSRYVSELANLPHDLNLPYVGTNAFTHKGGMHINAVEKNPTTFEHIPPTWVGNQRHFSISELSGKTNVIRKAKEYGLDISDGDPRVSKILNELKELEHRGYQFEGADASFELLMRRAQGEDPKFFKLIDYRVFDERNSGGDTSAEASIKIKVDDRELLTAGEGDGPVDALDDALRKALSNFYPQIEKIRLVDYKVRIMERERGTAAKPRVLIESTDGKLNWTTVGVSYDIIEASWKALYDSYIYGLASHHKK